MWWGAHDGMGWWMVFGSLWMLLFWGAIIGHTMADELQEDGGRPAGDCEEALCPGEITREEFEAIRATLSGGSASTPMKPAG
jgi:hypothetical protein